MPKNRRNTWHDIKTTNQKTDFFIFQHWGIIQCRKIISPLFQCARVDAFDACRYVHRFVVGSNWTAFSYGWLRRGAHAKSSTDLIQMPGTWKNCFPRKGDGKTARYASMRVRGSRTRPYQPPARFTSLGARNPHPQEKSFFRHPAHSNERTL